VLVGAIAAATVVVIALGFATSADDTEPARSACGTVGDRQPVPSPDGRRLAFVRCTPEGSAWLYVSERGEAARRVVPRRFNCCYRPSDAVVFADPEWSPDGRRLAVVIADVGGTDVWVIAPAQLSARRVTAGPARERDPRWSADGRRISFRTETGRVVSASVGRLSGTS
jgi:Tol biopolymer transport system component